MRVLSKQKIEYVYKLTCYEIDLIFRNKYRKKLGSSIATADMIVLTNAQIRFLLNIKCKGKATIGYLQKVNSKKFIFLDSVTVHEKYINLEKLGICEECIKKLSNELNNT